MGAHTVGAFGAFLADGIIQTGSGNALDSGHLGALGCKTSRRVVLDVVALGDHLQDLCPGLLVHIRVVVDDP